MSGVDPGHVMSIAHHQKILSRRHEERAAALFATMLAMRCGVLVLTPMLPVRKARVKS